MLCLKIKRMMLFFLIASSLAPYNVFVAGDAICDLMAATNIANVTKWGTCNAAGNPNPVYCKTSNTSTWSGIKCTNFLVTAIQLDNLKVKGNHMTSFCKTCHDVFVTLQEQFRQQLVH